MRVVLLTLLLVHIVTCQAQVPNTYAVKVLQKVCQKLNDLSGVRYRYIREMKYHADNYHNKDSAAIFIDFRSELPMGVRFQAKKRETIFIYNGTMTIVLDNSKMTMDTATILSPKRMESNSFLYSSLASLRNNLPLVIANDSIIKVVSDTMIDGKQMFVIRMEGSGMYLNSFKGIDRFNEQGLRRPYYLLVNKQTMLPYQLIGKIVKGEDNRDFITITYLDIQTKAARPAKESWNYVAYKRGYSPYVKAESFPLVKPGATVPFFTTPCLIPLKPIACHWLILKGRWYYWSSGLSRAGRALKQCHTITTFSKNLIRMDFNWSRLILRIPATILNSFIRSTRLLTRCCITAFPYSSALGSPAARHHYWLTETAKQRKHSLGSIPELLRKVFQVY